MVRLAELRPEPKRCRHPELVSGSSSPPALPPPPWMLNQVQHDEGGECFKSKMLTLQGRPGGSGYRVAALRMPGANRVATGRLPGANRADAGCKPCVLCQSPGWDRPALGRLGTAGAMVKIREMRAWSGSNTCSTPKPAMNEMAEPERVTGPISEDLSPGAAMNRLMQAPTTAPSASC